MLKLLSARDEATRTKVGKLRGWLKVLKRYVNFDVMGESRIARRTTLVHYDTF